MQNLRSRHVLGYSAALLVLLSGCAGSKKVVNVTAPPGQKVTVEMKASNFAFDPGQIVARKGDTLVLHVTNVSKEKHELTVKDPSGKIIQSADLPSQQTVTVEVPLTTAGVYPFLLRHRFPRRSGDEGQDRSPVTADESEEEGEKVGGLEGEGAPRPSPVLTFFASSVLRACVVAR